MGFQPEQKKNQENHFSSKGHDGLSIHIVLVFLTLVFHRSGIIHYIYMGISQRTSLDGYLNYPQYSSYLFDIYDVSTSIIVF